MIDSPELKTSTAMEFSFLLSLLLVQTSVLAVAPRARATVGSPSGLAMCLSNAGVSNFTIPSSNPSDEATKAFDRLLNFSMQNLRFASPASPKPVAVILPATKRQLRGAVLCCRWAALAIRVRSGGHSYEGLSYVSDQKTPFAIIDLMNLNHIRVDPGSRTAWVEAGATLGETYHAITLESGGTLGFSAGSCPTVGSGGHIAGGGYGLLSRKYGLAADNVLDAILIDPEGRVLNRSSMSKDVFWAIRGGGGGTWGALYAWKIRLLPVPSLVSCFIISRPGSIPRVAELVHEWQLVAPNLPDDFYISAFVGADLPEVEGRGFSATFKGFYLGPASKALKLLADKFPELGVTADDCHEMSWIESVVFFSELDEGSSVADLTNRELHPKNSFKAKSDYVRVPISKHDLEVVFDVLAKEPKAYVIMDPYGGAIHKIPSEEIPFPHRSGNLYSIQYMIEWMESENESGELYIEWLRGLYSYVEPLVSRGPRAAYVNYLDLDLGTVGNSNISGELADPVAEARSWGEKYFLGNFDRLVRAKTKIDPLNVFSNAQSIPPMLTTLSAGTGEEDSNHTIV